MSVTEIIFREDWFLNGIHYGRWFTDTRNDKIIGTHYEVYSSNEPGTTFDKIFILKNIFLYLTFNAHNKKPLYFHIPKKDIMGDFCSYCNKCHFFHISSFCKRTRTAGFIVYSKNCLSTTYTLKIMNTEQYYDKLNRLDIARKVCDYAKDLKNISFKENEKLNIKTI